MLPAEQAMPAAAATQRETGYAVLIRTFNSARTLEATLSSLRNQTIPPDQYVIVDSGSTDHTLSLLPPAATLCRFTQRPFNYSAALNLGVHEVHSEFVLILSSHTALAHSMAIEFAMSCMAVDANLAAAYFLPGPPADNMSLFVIDKDSFTGFNGIYNTCALIKTAMLKKRPFRPEVFASEDQEWSKWLLEEEGRRIAQISGAGMIYSNPIRDRRRKDLYESLAVAFYVKPEMFGVAYLMKVLFRTIRPSSTLYTRMRNVRLFLHLVYYRFVGKPTTINIFD